VDWTHERFFRSQFCQALMETSFFLSSHLSPSLISDVITSTNSISSPAAAGACRFGAHRPRAKSIDAKVYSFASARAELPVAADFPHDANLRRRNSIELCRLNRVSIRTNPFSITRRRRAVNACGQCGLCASNSRSRIRLKRTSEFNRASLYL